MKHEILQPVVTVAYRIVKGAAKLYPYVGAKVYRPVARRDGVLTYRPVAEPGPDRRSERLAEQDAREHAAKRGYLFLRSQVEILEYRAYVALFKKIGR